ncbi:O-antigen ligase family protein [Ekhidna lutea]|nr:O-antigen ligase family protein [Ekhidna lutea]
MLIPYWWICIDLKSYFKQGDFLYNLVRGIVYGTLLLSVIQYMFGGVYFNTQNRLPEVNIYFNNGNELGMFLSGFVPLYFFLERKSLLKWVVITLIIFLSWHNHARGTFVSALLFLFMYYNVVFFLRYKIFYMTLLIVSSTVLISILSSIQVFGITLIDFLVDPIVHIFTLDPIEPNIGSINNRANNIIFALQEFIDSYFIGIGPDNSRAMVQSHIVLKSHSTQSMHNMVIQIICEWGVVGILFMGYFLRSILTRIQNYSLANVLIILSIFSSILLTSSISSGPFVNYAYLLTFYTTILYIPEILNHFNKQFERD